MTDAYFAAAFHASEFDIGLSAKKQLRTRHTGMDTGDRR